MSDGPAHKRTQNFESREAVATKQPASLKHSAPGLAAAAHCIVQRHSVKFLFSTLSWPWETHLSSACIQVYSKAAKGQAGPVYQQWARYTAQPTPHKVPGPAPAIIKLCFFALCTFKIKPPHFIHASPKAQSWSSAPPDFPPQAQSTCARASSSSDMAQRYFRIYLMPAQARATSSPTAVPMGLSMRYTRCTLYSVRVERQLGGDGAAQVDGKPL